MKKKYLITLLSACFTALPFTVPSLFILSLVSPAIFFYYLYSSQGFKETFKISFLWTSVYYICVHYYFIALYPLDFAGLSSAASIAVVLLGWIGIALFQGVELALAFCLFKRIPNRYGFLTPVMLAAVFSLCEYLQSLGWVGFPWGQIALTQYKFLPYIQSLSLLGPYFLSFVTVLISALFAYFFYSKKNAYAIAAASVLAVNVLYGVIYMSIPTKVISSVDVAVVQPSILTEEKWIHLQGKSLYEIHMALSEEGKDADIILWSETAIPTDILANERYEQGIRTFAKENSTSFIMGTYYDDDEGNSYNAAAFVDSDSTSLYFKRHLVPFGEYVPWRSFFETCLPFLMNINMLSHDLASGDESTPLETHFGKIGALVCFDSIFSPIARESVDNGACMLAVVTNDSWYKKSVALYHHNAQSVFRAVENRRWVARCANTGVSSFIDEHGDIVYASKPYETVVHTESVELIESKTLYTAVGNIFTPLTFIFVFAVAVVSIKKRDGEKITDGKNAQT